MKVFVHFLTQLVLLLALAGACLAADPIGVDAENKTETASELTYSPQWPEPPNTGAMLARLAVGTVTVLVLCVGSLWLGKPWLQKLQTGSSISRQMRVEGSVSLGARVALHLVKIGDTQLVAGTDASGLKSLIIVPTTFREVLEEHLPGETTAPANESEFDVALRSVGSKGNHVQL